MRVDTVSLEAGGTVLKISGPEGALRFHGIWLRDNAQDAATRDPGNGQRLITMADMPVDCSLSDAALEGSQIAVTFAADGKRVVFDPGWLSAHAYDVDATRAPGALPPGCEIWDGTRGPGLADADFAVLQERGDGLCDWLRALSRRGVARVSGLPVVSGSLFGIVELFGYVRETNYGRHFEVRTEVNPVNLAYTGMGLQAHTDNPYRDPPPTVQVLACLENSASGGENMVVDGFAAARRLQREDPDGFDLLTRFAARFSYVGSAGVALHSRRPMIELASDGTLQAIRFNARAVAPLVDVPFDRMEGYYAAYRRLSSIIDDPDMEIRFKLAPGEAFVVDNTRVLHARKGYSGAGTRWLQGCYADRDGIASTLAVLEAKV